MFRFEAILVVLLIAFPGTLFAQNKQSPENIHAARQGISMVKKSLTGKDTPNNILLNGDFSNGELYWETWIHPEAEASGSVENEEFVMQIADGGSEVFHIQLKQNNLLIEEGNCYSISFEAYAVEPRNISISVQHSNEPYTIYHALWNMGITDFRQTYITSFVMTHETDATSRLVFDLGSSEHDVYIDNVKLSLAPLQEISFQRGINLTGWFQYFSSISEMKFKQYTRKDFENIMALGCDHIRLPMELFDMTGPAPDFTFDPLFFSFLDQVIDWAEELGLYLILDNHSFDPGSEITADILDQLLAVWAQLADHYKNRSNLIYFEILNEPHTISNEVWNGMQQQVIDVIRTNDKKHTIIVGPADWSNYNSLSLMPEYADTNLIYTFHFYDPFVFTSQGAFWSDPMLINLAGVPYPYDEARMPDMPEELAGTWAEDCYNRYAVEGNDEWVRSQIDVAVQFSIDKQVPVWCGEFGVYMPNSQLEDRVRWLSLVRSYMDNNNISWTMWEYGDGFGIFENSRELYEYDLNISIVEALGLTPPTQSEFELVPDSTGFVIYDDYVPQRVFYHNWNPGGVINYYSADDPKEGDYCISWSGSDRYSSIGFRFSPIHDLTQLTASNYMLDLWVRCNNSDTKIDLRFLDTKTQEPDDHAWRMRSIIDNTVVSWDGTWQHIRIPLSNFTEHGSWEDNTWYDPQGEFDWSQIEVFEIASDYHNMESIELFFDDIKITENPTGISKNDNNPLQFLQVHNHPNPFNSYTTIRYSIPQDSYVKLEIFNILGQNICTLIDEKQEPGMYSIKWNIADNKYEETTSGVYICFITAISENYTFQVNRKMILMKYNQYIHW